MLFNALLAGGLVFLILGRPKEADVSALVPQEAVTPTQAAPAPVPRAASATQPETFRWSQLDSGNDYRLFIANLRASGCPENTIEDIVRGNVGRAFAWKRAQLKIDASASGPWSSSSELELADSLLGKPSTAETAASPRNANGHVQAGGSQIAGGWNTGNAISQAGSEIAAATPSSQSEPAAGYPSFFPGGGPSATGAVGNQQAAANSPGGQVSNSANEPAHSANSFGPQTGTPASFGPGDSSNPGTTPVAGTPDASSTPTGPTDPLGANDPYAQSSQDIQNTEIIKYYDWFAPQVAANANGGNLVIDLGDYDPY